MVDRETMAGAAVEARAILPSLSIQRKHLTIFSVHGIAPPRWKNPLQRSLVSFRRPSASLPLLQPHPRVRVAHLYTAGLRPLVILPRHHHAGAGAGRPLSHHETTSGTAGVEGATVAAHRRAEDVSARHRRRGGALPVGAPTTLVADAVQAHVTPEKAAHCPASGRRLLRVGNGASGIGVRTGAGAGVWRTGETLQKAV
jgi:hypothetical protein